MNRIRLLAIGTLLLFALTTVAQQATTSADSATKGVSAGDHIVVPTADGQLKFLAAKLALTSDQQEKMKPILQELHAATAKLVQDQSISREEYLGKLSDSYYAADKKMRLILNDDQKKKLDQVEHEPHPELHGTLSSAKN
jgi:Spy/CpxP family protein refolding chaperone